MRPFGMWPPPVGCSSGLFTCEGITPRQPSNKRLKLAGADRSKGSGVLCPGAHEHSFTDTARGGRVARSLSAIR
jgi:hypothetical protein